MIEVERRRRYKVYSPQAVYLNDYEDVISEFSLDEENNAGGGALEIVLGRSPTGRVDHLETLLDENDEPLTDENDEPLLGTSSTSRTVGPGTDVDFNNQVYVDEYFGRIETLLDENDEPLEDENDEPLEGGWGALRGRRRFSGFISRYGPKYLPDGEHVAVTCLPFSADMKDYVFKKNERAITSVNLQAQTFDGGSTLSGETEAFVMSFTAAESAPLSSIQMAWRANDPNLYRTISFTGRLYLGGDPNGARTLIDTATFQTNAAQATNITGLRFRFGGSYSLVSGQQYHIEVTPQQKRTTTANAYPISMYGNDDSFYSGGTAYTKPVGSSTYTAMSKDLYIFVYVTDNETSVSVTNKDLGNLLTDAAFQATTEGARLYYSLQNPDTIEESGVLVSATFKTNTIREVLEFVERASPEGWYWYYDNEDSNIWFQPRAEKPHHIFRRGIELQSVEIETSIENLANDIYVIGGGEPPLYRRYADQASINAYGRRSLRITDQRITVEATADIIGAYNLQTRKDPVHYTTVTVLDVVYDITTIKPGHVVSFQGFGTFIDELQLQVTKIAHRKGKAILTLGQVPRTERRKVEDLKRALDLELNKDNPTAPS